MRLSRWALGLGLAVAWNAAAQPQITQQPTLTNSVVAVGADVTLRVAATGRGVLGYQWRLNGVRIPGALTNVYSLTNLQVPQGGLYRVAVKDADGVVYSQPVRLVVDVPVLPFSDDFEATNKLNGVFTNTIVGLSGSGRGANTNATRQTGEPLHAGKAGLHSVWLTWAPPQSGVALLDTKGSGFDTLLAVYTGGVLTNLSPVAANDDQGGFLTSLVKFNALSNTTYHIAVDGRGGAAGNIALNWNLVPAHHVATIVTAPKSKSGENGTNVSLNVTFTNALPVTVQWLFNGTNIKQTLGTNADSLELADLDETKVGNYVARITTATGETVDTDPVSVQIHHRRDGGEDRQEISAEDKFSDLVDSVTDQAQALADLPAGFPVGLLKTRSRRVRAGLAGGLASGYTGTQIFSTFGATTDPGEPSPCAVIGGASMWYAYQAPTNGLLTLDTQGSNFDTVLGVYTGSGTDFTSLVQVACAATNVSNGTNRWSQASVAASSGTVYYIAVDGVDGAIGTVNLNYHLAVAPNISGIADQTAIGTAPVGPLPFSVSDVNWPATNLTLAASSSDTNLVPNANITFAGSGTNRSVTVTPAAGPGGTAAITISVTDPDGAAAGVTFMLTVVIPPSITGQPQGQTAAQGGTVTLSVSVAGTSPFHFQWRLNGINLSGATNSALVLANVQSTNAGDYTVRVSNGAGAAVSGVARVAVQIPVPLTSSRDGSTGDFRVTLTSLPGRSYVFQASVDLQTWTALATGIVAQSTLTFTDTNSPNFGHRFYRAVSGP